MTLLQYIQSLQDQGLSEPEIFAKAEIWKKNNPQPEVEEVEETEEVVETEDGKPSLFTTSSYINNVLGIKTFLDPTEDEEIQYRIEVGGTKDKIGKEYTVAEIQEAIDKNKPGFENIESVDQYIKEHRGKAKFNIYSKTPSEGTITAFDPVTTSRDIQLQENLPYNVDEMHETLGDSIWFDENDTHGLGQGYAQENLTNYINNNTPEGFQGRSGYYSPKLHGDARENLDSFKNDNLFYFDVTGDDHDELFTANNNEQYTGINPINIPLAREERINKLTIEARDNSELETQDILEIGKSILQPEEIEFNKLMIEFDNMEEGEEKVELGKKIEKIAEDENFGKKLYDPATGNIIDFDKADIATIELFSQAENLSETTEIEQLQEGLGNQYYEVNGLITDILKNEEEYELYKTADRTSIPKWWSPSHPLQRISDEQLKLLKEFKETGKMPVGLKHIKGGHPLSEAFNKSLDEYIVMNKAVALNRNPLTRDKTWGGDELISFASRMFGSDNIITDNDARQLFVDGMHEDGFTFVGDYDLSYALESGIAQEAAATFPHLAEFAAEIYLTRKVSGNLLNKFATKIKKLSNGYTLFKNSPTAHGVFKTTIDAMREGAEFSAASGLFGDLRDAPDSFVFGTALGFGNPLYRGFTNWLNRGFVRKMFSPITARLLKSHIYKGGISTLASGFAGASVYQMAGIMTNPTGYFDQLREQNSSFTKTQAVETIKMIALGRLSKGIAGMSGIKRAFIQDITYIGSKGRSNMASKAAAEALGIDNNLIEKPQENSEKAISDAVIEQIQKLAEQIESKEITEEKADELLKEINLNKEAALTQLAVNTAYDVILAEKAKNNNLIPTDAQMYVISNKLSKGEELTEAESQQLSNLPQDAVQALLAKNHLNIPVDSDEEEMLSHLYVNNAFIQHQLNGGGTFYSPKGITWSQAGQWNTKSGTPLRQEVYEFLNKQSGLNFTLSKLTNKDKSKLTETEKIKLEKDIKDLKLQIEDYSEGGKTHDELQQKVQDEANKGLEEDIRSEYNLPGSSKAINSRQQVQDIYDSWGLKDKNVKDEIAVINPITKDVLINMEVAKEVKDMTAKTHEDVHKITMDFLHNKEGKITEEGIEIIDEVIDILSPNQQKLLNEKMADKYGEQILSRPKEEWYDENLTVLSELIKGKKIQFTEEFGEKLKDFLPFYKKKLPNLDVENVTGQQLFNMLRGFAQGEEVFIAQAEAFARDSKELKGEIVPSKEVAAAASAAQKPAQTLIEEYKNDPENFKNDAELRKNIHSLAAAAMGYNLKQQQEFISKGGKGISQEQFESFVDKFIPILKKRYDKEKHGTNFSTYVTNTYKRKWGDMLKEHGITEDQYKNISIEQMREKGIEPVEEIVSEEVVIKEPEVKETIDPFKLQGLSPEFSKNFYEEMKTKLQDDLAEGIDISDKKYIKKTEAAVFETLANELGIPVSRITNPRDNLRKNENLNIQKFILKNVDQMLKLMPEGNMRVSEVPALKGDKTIKIGGEPMGIPGNVRKIFYEETGEFINGSKQYRLKEEFKGPKARENFLNALKIVKGELVGFNPRSPEAQTLKGMMQILGKNMSNKATRDITIEATETGELPSKIGANIIGARLDSKPAGMLSAKPKAGNTFRKRFNSLLEGKGLKTLEEDALKRNENIRGLILNDFADAFGSNAERVFGWLGAGGIVPRKGASTVGGTQAEKRGEGGVLQQVATKYGIESPEYKAVLKGLEDGSIMDIPTLNAELSKEIERREIEIDPAEARKVKLALTTQTAGRIDKNKEEYADIQEGKEIIFEKFREIYEKDPNKLGTLIEMMYTGTANNHPFRGFATVMGLEKGLEKGEKGREEHFFQFGNFAEGFAKAVSGSDKVWNGFKEWSKKNYWQTKISEEQRRIIDQKTVDTDFRTGEKIAEYSPDSGMHPLFEDAWNKALETGDFSKVPDVRMRAYNEYFTANPNKLGREYQNEDGTWEYRTDAEDFNVNVDKKFEDNQIVINEQGLLIDRIIKSEAGIIPEDSPNYLTRENAREQMNAYEALVTPQVKTVSAIKTPGSGLNLPNAKDLNPKTTEEGIYIAQTLDNAVKEGNKINIETGEKEKKSATVGDVDGTIVNDRSRVKVEMPDGTAFNLTPREFAEQSKELEEQGAEFNFDDFGQINKGKEASFFDRYKEQYDQHGGENMFVLSARPPEFAPSMHAWFKSKGMDIPIENITGLGNGTPGAKANWFIKKGGEGYNDFLFADDVLANSKAVQGVLNQLQLGGEVQAKLSAKPKTFNETFNKNLEILTKEKGNMIGADWQFSAARAKSLGEKKNLNPFKNFIFDYAAEDFNGLLYATLPRGEAGNKMKEFYQTNLLDPFNRAERKIETAKIAASNDFKELKKRLTKLPKSMHTETGIGGFSFGDAARVAIWTQQNSEIPGLSKRDQKKLNKFVNENGDLSVFVNEVVNMQKGKEYPKPGEDWLAGTMTTDIMGEINKVNRKEYLAEWKQNHSIIFSVDNKNKLRAALGNKYVDNLERTLARMESGSNKPLGQNKITGDVLDWINGSVGATMFLNTRSAALQTISSVNYLNWGDNNIVAAGKAFANQKQYWKDFKTLFNSDYLVNRREGLNINVSESEIADASKKGGAKGAIAYLLNQGFIMTRGADSFAIASGGATFYRNRINKLMKEGMSEKDAKWQAFEDFRFISEENQQSSSPMRISEQQASGAGRVILAFANTPMQYARIIKRSSEDLVKGRGDWRSNLSKIVYYGAAQNLIFNGLQNALWAESFDEDGEDSSDRGARTANGMADSLLSGLGIQGKAAVAIKNSLITIAKENGKDSPDFKKAINDLFDFSPPLDAKLRRAQSAANTFSWEQEKMKNEGFNLNNPAYLASGQIVSAATNIPLDRAMQKINNLRAITSNSSENWQKVALALGWSTWDVGLPYYGVEDKIEETPEMVMKNRIVDMKKSTTSKEQKQTLLKLGVSREKLRKLKYEEDRIKMIIKLQDQNKKTKK